MNLNCEDYDLLGFFGVEPDLDALEDDVYLYKVIINDDEAINVSFELIHGSFQIVYKNKDTEILMMQEGFENLSLRNAGDTTSLVIECSTRVNTTCEISIFPKLNIKWNTLV